DFRFKAASLHNIEQSGTSRWAPFKPTSTMAGSLNNTIEALVERGLRDGALKCTGISTSKKGCLIPKKFRLSRPHWTKRGSPFRAAASSLIRLLTLRPHGRSWQNISL